jgi:hypothetical protein
MAQRLLELPLATPEWSIQIQSLLPTLSHSDDRKSALSNYYSLLENSLFVDGTLFSSRIPLPLLLASAIHPVFLIGLPLIPTYLYAWLCSWLMTPSDRPEGVGPHKSQFGHRAFLITVAAFSAAIYAYIPAVRVLHLPAVYVALFGGLYYLHLVIADPIHLQSVNTPFTV